MLLQWLALQVTFLRAQLPPGMKLPPGVNAPTPEQQKMAMKMVMRGIYAKIDTDKDGNMTLSELKLFSRKAKIKKARNVLFKVMKEFDKNRDQKLTLTEITEALHDADLDDEEDGESIRSGTDPEIRKFKAADADGNGVLEENEIVSYVQPELNPKVLDTMAQNLMAARDKDGDGKLTIDEAGGIEGKRKESDFKFHDEDGDGFWSLQELRDWESGQKKEAEMISKIMEACDLNGDGVSDVDEFEGVPHRAPQDVNKALAELAMHAELSDHMLKQEHPEL